MAQGSRAKTQYIILEFSAGVPVSILFSLAHLAVVATNWRRRTSCSYLKHAAVSSKMAPACQKQSSCIDKEEWYAVHGRSVGENELSHMAMQPVPAHPRLPPIVKSLVTGPAGKRRMQTHSRRCPTCGQFSRCTVVMDAAARFSCKARLAGASALACKSSG